MPLLSIQKSAPWSLDGTRKKKGCGRIGDGGEHRPHRPHNQTFLPRSFPIPSLRLPLLHQQVHGFQGSPGNLALVYRISTGSHCSSPCQSDLLGLLRLLQLGMGPMYARRNVLRSENQKTPLCCLFTSILWLHPSLQLSLGMQNFLSGQSSILTVNRNYFTLQSFFWICTTFIRKLLVE